jgi:ATP-dependent Clp protease ATP-binding subunit ClpC
MASEFSFNLKKARIYQAVKWSGVFGWLKFFKTVSLLAFIFFLICFIFGFLTQSFSDRSNATFLGLTLMTLSLFLASKIKVAFFNQKLKKPAIADQNNLAEFLDFETAKVIRASDIFAESSKLPPTNSTALFHFLLEKTHGLEFIFSRNLLDLKEIRANLKIKMKEYIAKGEAGLGYTQDYQDTIRESLKIARNRNHPKMVVGDILSALAVYDPVFQKILMDADLKKEDIENLTWWLESLEKIIENRKRWWEYANLMKKGSLAKEWTSGYTITLDRYSTDWTALARRNGFPEIIGHEEQIEQAERVLGRREFNNALLVGEPGVGRKSIIQGLVEKTILGQSLPGVNYKRVVELNMSSLLADIPTSEELEAVLDRIFQEAISAGNVILVIDEFQNFIGVKPGPGKIDISGSLSPYLSLPQFQIVAITDFTGLHKNIEQSPSILGLFEKIEVPEISERETMMILESTALMLEQRYKIFASYPALRHLVNLAKRFMPAIPFPKKALDLLDEVMIYVKKSTKDRVLLPIHVAKIITEKTQVPVGEIEVKEKETLLNLEKLIHERIINQEQAVKEVSTALRRARSEITIRKGPMGAFLFMGPTGVGKTETAKALAQIYFNSESHMIRLDMSEFQDTKDIPRLLGSAGEEGILTTPVIENPFSLILLDEIEKAHPNILNLFLQVIDEGFVTDGLGRKVDFKSSIIIATSNAGYQIILEALKEKTPWDQVKQKLLDYIFDKGIFRPEFINRFDATVVFTPLSKEHLLKIAELMLKSLKQNLKEKGIELVVTQPLKEKIVELGYDPTFGAREMRRVIQDNIENALASALLSGDLKRGQKAEIEPENFKLIIK